MRARLIEAAGREPITARSSVIFVSLRFLLFSCTGAQTRQQLTLLELATPASTSTSTVSLSTSTIGCVLWLDLVVLGASPPVEVLTTFVEANRPRGAIGGL